MYLDILPWAMFLAFVAGMLALDLGVFHRNAHEVSRREALAWSAVWIGLAIVFNIGVYVLQGSERGLEWTTGYLIEKSLSVDNVFVFLLIFSMFTVPAQYQHRVLFWGIVGALFMRAILILVGAALLDTAHFVIYVFGGFLILTGIKFLLDKGEHAPSLDRNWLVRLARRVRPVTDAYEGQKFVVRREGILSLTPLFLVLLLIESTDLVFAVDSIPAIFAVTDDPFIVFTSNIFAILGLRALYFVLSGYLSGLAYLKPALAAILVFVGTKMVLADVYKIDPLMSLAVIALILVGAVGASLLVQREGGGVPLPGTRAAERQSLRTPESASKT
jgi:tellurite resistance protein TerC